MEFEKVEKEHILLGIKDFEEKGIPKGFGPSSTYNLVFEGKEYPPKAVMAYANYHAAGKEISRYFKGGLGTDCFNSFERNGFEIILKDGEADLFSIIEKLKSMIPESEFTFINERSRSVWVSDSENLIGRKGAHYEFILRNNRDGDEGVGGYEISLQLHFEKASSQEIFKEKLNVKNSKIEWYDLPGTLRIRFLSIYFTKEKDLYLKMASGLREFDDIIGDQVRDIIKKLPSSVMNNRLAFEKYLEASSTDRSGKASSYIRAIEILSEFKDINENLFETEDTSFLNSLYEIVKRNQIKDNGTYYNEKNSYGKGRYYSAAVGSYIQFLNQKNNKKISRNMSSIPLNQILYGPPGTGKTYNTINKAIEIVNPDFDLSQSRNIVKLEFDRLCKEKRIHFTTFHQSLSYEDFIEGIKPCIEEDDDSTELKYEIQNGIFKRISDEASFELLNSTKAVSNPLLNFSSKYDAFLTEVSRKLEENEDIEITTKTGNKLVILSISNKGNFKIKHIDGETLYTVSKQRLLRLKKGINDLYSVENMSRDFRAVIGGSNSSVYWSVWNAVENTVINEEEVLSERKWSESDKSDFVESSKPEDYKGKDGSPYVIIIDEINRGNVSQVFGELITLIEDEKRLGNDEGLKIQLPYSKKNYGVPNNLYILGTMNTADRSVEALDTALRRRFSFIELLPDSNIITKSKSGGVIEGINIPKLLNKINERIEVLIDRDHTIGHAFFMSVGSLKEMKVVMSDKIIPLLQEYFYENYDKMEMVIGSGFFNKTAEDKVVFAVNNDHQFDGESFEIIDAKKMSDVTFKEAIAAIKF